LPQSEPNVYRPAAFSEIQKLLYERNDEVAVALQKELKVIAITSFYKHLAPDGAKPID
jgi:hypothetical protein